MRKFAIVSRSGKEIVPESRLDEAISRIGPAGARITELSLLAQVEHLLQQVKVSPATQVRVSESSLVGRGGQMVRRGPTGEVMERVTGRASIHTREREEDRTVALMAAGEMGGQPLGYRADTQVQRAVRQVKVQAGIFEQAHQLVADLFVRGGRAQLTSFAERVTVQEEVAVAGETVASHVGQGEVSGFDAELQTGFFGNGRVALPDGGSLEGWGRGSCQVTQAVASYRGEIAGPVSLVAPEGLVNLVSGFLGQG
jgi:hypothetical protein